MLEIITISGASIVGTNGQKAGVSYNRHIVLAISKLSSNLRSVMKMSPFLKKMLFAPEKHKPQQYYLRHLKADVKTTLAMFLINS